jgi:NTE family protein
MAQEDTLKRGLALSGGGFRATLFHLGALWRLNELGWLRQLDIITSVSGGSIVNGVLALRWSELAWQGLPGGGETAANFAEKIAAPIRQFCAKSIDVSSVVIGGLSPFSSIAEEVARTYDKFLFNGATLQDLPTPQSGQTPRFLFYASSLQTGSSVRMERKRFADYKIGEIPSPVIPLARVVGASSAFPPVLSPVTFEFDPAQWQPLPGATLYPNEDLRRRVMLTDGGVYDNLGLEAIYDRCETVLVSDASAPFDIVSDASHDPLGQMTRVNSIMMEQTRALRRRAIIGEFESARRKGTFWGIATKISDYELADPLVQDSPIAASLEHIRTRLNQFSAEEQGHLINWGYALADAAMRRRLLAGPPAIVATQPDPDFML